VGPNGLWQVHRSWRSTACSELRCVILAVVFLPVLLTNNVAIWFPLVSAQWQQSTFCRCPKAVMEVLPGDRICMSQPAGTYHSRVVLRNGPPHVQCSAWTLHSP
jgi:hypothetical protein